MIEVLTALFADLLINISLDCFLHRVEPDTELKANRMNFVLKLLSSFKNLKSC